MERSTTRGEIALGAALLAPPAAWMLDLLLLYSLQRYVCATGAVWLFHLSTAAALGVAGAAGAVAWRALPPQRESERRRRFLAVSGVALSAGFVLLILAEAVPTLLLEPCR